MKSIGVREIRSALPHYLKKVSVEDEVYQITRHGKTLALLCPVSTEEKVKCTDEHGRQPGTQLQIDPPDIRKDLIKKTQKFMEELEAMGRPQLENAFAGFFENQPPQAMSEQDLRKAIARANQHELWIEATGTVPIDIIRRDRNFWGRIVCALAI